MMFADVCGLSMRRENIGATAFSCEQGKSRNAPLLSETLQNEMHDGKKKDNPD